jgi:hypothetical protein
MLTDAHGILHPSLWTIPAHCSLLTTTWTPDHTRSHPTCTLLWTQCLYIAPCTLHSVHVASSCMFSLHTVPAHHCRTLHPAHRTEHTTPSSSYPAHGTLHQTLHTVPAHHSRTLHPAHHTLLTAPCTVHPAHHILLTAPCTKPCTQFLHITPGTLHPAHHTLVTAPCTLPYTQHTPCIPHPRPPVQWHAKKLATSWIISFAYLSI